MTKKTVALLICASLAFSAVGCAGQSGTSSAQAPVEETSAAEPIAEEAEKAEEAVVEEAASAAQTIVDKDALEASAEITTGEGKRS